MKKTLLSIACLLGTLISNAQCVGALDLPTNTDYVQFTNPFYSYTNEITVEGWVYMDGSANSTPWVGQATAGLDNMSTNVWHWHGANANELAWEVNDNGTWRHASSSTMSNGWHHIATVADNASTRIYIDGVLDATGPAISGAMRSNSNSEIHVGHDVRFAAGTGGRNGDYKMGELRVWNVARTQSEISANMSSCLTGSENGLKLYNKFENGPGSSVTTSAVGPNGTLVNMTPSTNWVTGSGSECCTPASALNFDGSDDYVSIPSGINVANQSFTVEFWAKRNGSGNGDYVVSQQSSTSTNNALHIGFRDNNAFTFAFYGNDLDVNNTATTDGNYHHWACVYNAGQTGNNRFIYLDGSLIASDMASGNYTGSGALYLGLNIFGGEAYNGELDETRIWNLARTQCEIISYMNCEIPSAAAGLLANYHFNQGVASGANATVMTLTDASGNSNDGTESNFSLSGSSSNWISPGGVTSGNVTPSTCTMASALNFDGSNDQVALGPINISGGGARTIEFWLKTAYTGNFQNPFSSGNANPSEAFNIKVTPSGHLGFMGFANDIYPSSGTFIADNTFHHVAITYDGTTVKAYIDGNHEWDFAANLITTGEDNYIGQSNHINNEQYFGGTLDELRIWNTVRSNCEIISYKNCEIPATMPGLVANYHFNQGVDMMANPLITILTDASGNSIDGTLANFALNGSSSNWVSPGAVISGFSTSIACPLASALNFDGNDDGVDFGTSMTAVLDPLNTITVEAWVNPATTSGLGVIIGNYANGNSDMQFLLRRDGDQYAFWVSEGSGFQVVNSGSSTVLTNTWQHVAGVWNGSELKIYIDGVLKATTTGVTGSSFETISNPVVIGRNTINENFLGSIDETRVWTTARSQCEIVTYMNSEIAGSMTGLLLSCHFNQGLDSYLNSGETTLLDFSGNGNDGSLGNFSLNGTSSNWVAPGGVVSGYTTTPAAVSVDAVTTNSVMCFGNSTILNGTGADMYSWSDGVTDGVAFTPTATATYSVTGTNTVSTCSAMAMITITVNPLPVVTVNSGTVCAGQAFTMTPGGALTYTFADGSNVYVPAVGASYSVTTHDVAGEDANGCVGLASSYITAYDPPVISAATNNTLLCTGETATLSVTGALSYSWSTTETASEIAVSPVSQTTYTVEGTDANGCSNITTITQDVSLCTGIATLNGAGAQLNSIYPNPNNGVFYIELTTISKISIMDALGQTIVNEEEVVAGKHELNIRQEVKGIYFVKVIQNNQQQVIKIIKE